MDPDRRFLITQVGKMRLPREKIIKTCRFRLKRVPPLTSKVATGPPFVRAREKQHSAAAFCPSSSCVGSHLPAPAQPMCLF